MLILVNGAMLTVGRFRGHPHLGALLTPRCKNSPRRLLDWGMTFGVDNGAAGAEGFEPAGFLRLLSKIIASPLCRFVAAPDVVRKVGNDFEGNAAATLERFATWAPLIRELGLPAALVAQDGLERMRVPWSMMDALFVGGSTQWKLSAASAEICHEAKRRGLWVHVGRVNSLRRMAIVKLMGADSIDGSHFTRWPDTHIPIGLRWVERVHRQAVMFGPPAA